MKNLLMILLVAAGVGLLAVAAAACQPVRVQASCGTAIVHKQAVVAVPLVHQEAIIVATPAVVVATPVIVPATVFQFLPAYSSSTTTTTYTGSAYGASVGHAPCQPCMPAAAPGASGVGAQGDIPMAQDRQSAAPAPRGSVGAASDAAVRALSTRCASCHTGAGSKGSLQIFTAPGILNTGLNRGQKALCSLRTDIGEMPPAANGDPASAAAATNDEAVAIKEWAAAGAP